MSALYASRCYSCTSLMAAPCTEWYIALRPSSTLFSCFLRSVAFLLQAVCSQSIGFRPSRRALSPTLLCNAQWQAFQHPYCPQIHTLQMLDNTLPVHEIAI